MRSVRGVKLPNQAQPNTQTTPRHAVLFRTALYYTARYATVRYCTALLFTRSTAPVALDDRDSQRFARVCIRGISLMCNRNDRTRSHQNHEQALHSDIHSTRLVHLMHCVH